MLPRRLKLYEVPEPGRLYVVVASKRTGPHHSGGVHPVGYMFYVCPEWYDIAGFFAQRHHKGWLLLSGGVFRCQPRVTYSIVRVRPATPEEEAVWRLGGGNG